ncbi:T-complex protein 11-domain-containing protein [Irpex rosettiformis]|uniref:T-complex protein 11-domain-containing protein n=1 Tax=Irpex rosettiformis TaxID=378272 RepID=A0ACB8TWZ3_9APHY|nr:T-complex protein 11-domain-containing protein [Irpex rosettiformis]
MDDCPNDSQPSLALSRKRKADPVDLDDHQSQDHSQQQDTDALRLDPAATPRIPTDAPEVHAAPAAWLLVHHHRIWQQTSSSRASSSRSVASAPLMPVDRQEGPSRPKRPRIEIPSSVLTSPRKIRRGRVLYSGVPYSPRRFARHTRPARVSQSLPVSPIDVTPPVHSYTHVPPHQPPINRETLKELDLEAILRNPQLRHDLLFDPGLQFRPTFSPRKRNIAESYWIAIVRELETGCTCTTLDSNGKPIERRCVCSSIPIPVDKPIRAYSSSGSFTTVRMPSRLRPLLTELLEVLISIIQPAIEPRSSGPTAPSTSTSTDVEAPASNTLPGLHPNLLHPHSQQNASHVSYLRSILDIDLIQQEIGHGLFDPSGVFQAIGDIIRCYCAPMRDHSVDQMVELAKSCAPGGTGTKNDAVRAIRMCFEIMELMKLDVANHQLQTLRPYLVHSAAQFELKMFQEKTSNSPSRNTLTLDGTRQWLQAAWDELATQPMRLPKSVTDTFFRAPRTQQIQMAATRAIVNLVFDPPAHLTSASASSSTASSPANSPPSSPRPLPSTSPSASSSTSTSNSKGYPETLYLDHLRLTTLRNDAADFTALYMLLMLYRQLVHSGSSTKAGKAPAVSTEDLLALKKEVWEIGPARLGWCFAKSSSNTEQQWRDGINDVVLQLVMRASSSSASSQLQDKTRSHPLPTAQDMDAKMLKIATSWTESHLRSDSPLSGLMKKRIKRVVEEMVLAKVFSSSPSSGLSSPLLRKSLVNPPVDVAAGLGLDPLLPEIRHLADRLGKLVSIHMNVYGALYVQPRFLKTGSTNTSTATTTTTTLIRSLALTSISDSDNHTDTPTSPSTPTALRR